MGMVQCTEICSYTAAEECLEKIIYKYYLIEDSKTIHCNDSNVDLKSYGIKVVKEAFAEGTLNTIEEDFVEDISPNVDKVLNLIDFLKNHGVSPVHLLDIIGETVDEWVEDFDDVIHRELGKVAYC